ncbi:MAG TPA: tetratricopeptide repeat protein [Micropepsaceae bacterium]
MGNSDLIVGEAVPPRTMREQLKNPARKKSAARVAPDERAKETASDTKDAPTDVIARLERRLAGLEKTIANIANVVERHEITLREREEALASVAQSVVALRSQMEQSEKQHAAETAELHAALAQAGTRLNALEAAKAATPAPAAAIPGSAIEAAPCAPPIVWAGENGNPAAAAATRAPQVSATGTKDTQVPSYLSAARSAANHGTGVVDKKAAVGARRIGRTQLMVFGCVAPLVLLATGAFVLNHHPVTAEPVPAKTAFVPPPEAPLPPPPQIIIAPPSDPTAEELANSASLDALQQKAKTGDADAERDIGLKYLAGDTIPVNEEEAARWLLRASYRGEPSAEYWLGTLYSRGRGVPADLPQANHWYGASAKQGNPYAMYRLGIANFEGLGMDSNAEQAAHWFTQAAEMGLIDSQFDLAVLYERGMGVMQSLPDAYKWYTVAATQGDKEAGERAAQLAKALKPAELADATRASAEFKPELPAAVAAPK